MIIRVLAGTPDCRDGNCPTAYLTDRGTVAMQGYEVAGEGAVEVPEQIVMTAASALRGIAETAAGEARGVRYTTRGTVIIPGDGDSLDARTIAVPAGERAVEVAAPVVRLIARTINAREGAA